MTAPAPVLAPALRAYSGTVTDPSRWRTWEPRRGDVLVCTPPKCGTTWTQSMVAMLLHGGADLPAPVPVISPWIDADLGVPGEEVAAGLAAQPGRRVVKTHTPADGFPVWQDLTVIAVYRHPLDIFFSLRKHIANTKVVRPDHPMAWPLARSFRQWVEGPAEIDDFDLDSLATVVAHYAHTALSGRLPGLHLFHYADMLRDNRATVERLAAAVGIAADAALIDEVAQATAFGAMKANAANYAPVGGTGYWKSDAAFFDSGQSRKWEGLLSEEDLGRFDMRLAELLPDARARAWLLEGGDPPV